MATVVGARVVVPLGNRIVTGIVMDDASASTVEEAAIKPLKERTGGGIKAVKVVGRAIVTQIEPC